MPKKRSTRERAPYDPRHVRPPRHDDQCWCFIDPSTNDTGYAVCTIGYEDDRAESSRLRAQLHEVGSIRGEAPAGEWINRTLAICDTFRSTVEPYEITHVFLELPEHYAGSGLGQSAANSQAIVKLAASSLALVYAVRSAFAEIGVPPLVTAVEPKKWKGQAPKAVTAARVKRAWGFVPENHNAADALSMADWLCRKHFKIDPKNLSCVGAVERDLVATVKTISFVTV